MLQKREGFRKAYAGFDPEKVARFGERQYARLLNDPGIIRNRLKIRAVAENARRVLALRESHGSFAKWLDAHHPQSQKEWQKLFKETFVFTGGKIVQAFLMSIGYLPGAHDKTCPIFRKALRKKPAWAKARKLRKPRG
jgi:DNA-3-methyladenine glycosylase I